MGSSSSRARRTRAGSQTPFYAVSTGRDSIPNACSTPRTRQGVERQLAAAQRAATAAGVSATPSFLAGLDRSRVGAPGGRVAGAGCLPARAGPTAREMNDRVLRVTPCGAFGWRAPALRRMSSRPAGRTLDYSARPVAARRFSAPPTPSLGVPVAGLGLPATSSPGAATAVRGQLARSTVAALALGAAVFSGYLLVVQLVVIDAVCDWCLASDAISSLIKPWSRSLVCLQPDSGQCRSDQSDLAAPFGERARSARARRGSTDRSFCMMCARCVSAVRTEM